MSETKKPKMKVVYVALKSVHMGGGNYRTLGDLIPEATTWKNVDAEIRLGTVFPVFVATLDDETKEALAEWEEEREAEAERLREEQAQAMALRDNPPQPVEVTDESEEEHDGGDGDEEEGDDALDFEAMTIAELKAYVDGDEDTAETGVDYKANDNHATMVEHAKNAHAIREGRYGDVTIEVLHAELDFRDIEYASSDLKDDLIALLEADDESDHDGDTPSE